jgi:hypothetical protein
MRPWLPLFLLAPALAWAQPRTLGTFDDWTAAVTGSGAGQICYAVTTAKSSRPSGLARQGQPTLTVAHRGASRDEVTVRSGFAHAANATLNLRIAGTTLPFYTDANGAYARDRRGAVAALRRGAEAVAESPAPRGTQGTVADTFSLRGFSAAYERISQECRGR